MHELGLIEAVLAEVSERFEGERVLRIVLEVGALAAVAPGALAACFEACRDGAGLGEATLDVRTIAGRARCRACAASVALHHPLGACACGSADLEWLDGQALRLREVEVA